MKHFLKYGAVWIMGALTYVTFFWVFPWTAFGEWKGVVGAHAGVLMFFWFLYGIGAFDGDP